MANGIPESGSGCLWRLVGQAIDEIERNLESDTGWVPRKVRTVDACCEDGLFQPVEGCRRLVTVGSHPGYLLAPAAALLSVAAAEDPGDAVLYFTRRAAPENFGIQLLSIALGVAPEDLRQGLLCEERWAHLTRVLASLTEACYAVRHAGRLSPREIGRRLDSMDCPPDMTRFVVFDDSPMIEGWGEGEPSSRMRVRNALDSLAEDFGAIFCIVGQACVN